MKDIVVPGDLVEETPVKMRHTYIENGKTYSLTLGIYDKESSSLVPLEGVWNPRIDDTIVGIVTGVRNSVYEVDLGYYGRSIIIGGKFDRFSFRIGDVVEAKIKNIEEKRTIILNYPKLLTGGTVINVKPSKVPRIIGKGNTMIKEIEDATKSQTVVGTNGRIWIRGGQISLAAAAIHRIESEAHVSGLTERIKKMMEEKIA
jgi:exosome complex component RRP4